jgi:hypothetical protein
MRRQENAVPFFLLADTFIRFSQVARSRLLLLKTVCEHLGNVPTSRKKGIKIQKRTVQIFKRFL